MKSNGNFNTSLAIRWANPICARRVASLANSVRTIKFSVVRCSSSGNHMKLLDESVDGAGGGAGGGASGGASGGTAGVALLNTPGGNNTNGRCCNVSITPNEE